MWGKTLLAERGNDRFAARRRLRRRRALIASGFLFLFVGVGVIYGLNQDGIRIATVQVFGADQSVARVAERALEGKYLGIIPRNSSFFFPAQRIRSDILFAYPNFAAVSLFRSGLTSLSIRVDSRVPIAAWCGASPLGLKSSLSVAATTTYRADPDCFVFDASGVIYGTTTAEQPVNSFAFYEPHELPADSAAGATLIGSTLPHADLFPSAFDFARQLSTFGSPVTSVAFREEEVDHYLSSGTRVTYVQGNEKSAFSALVSAGAHLSLSDGSLEYVDLRFEGKVYIKKRPAVDEQ